MPSQDLNALSATQRRRVGLALVILGILGALLIHSHPQALQAPAWVAYTATASFVLAGVAVFLHASASRRVYAWLMAALLGVMSLIPAWVALGPGERQCWSALLPIGELGCRVAFGVGAVVMLGAVALAVAIARKASSAA